MLKKPFIIMKTNHFNFTSLRSAWKIRISHWIVWINEDSYTNHKTKCTRIASNIDLLASSFHRRCLNFIYTNTLDGWTVGQRFIASDFVVFHTKTHENKPNTINDWISKPPPSAVNEFHRRCFSFCFDECVMLYCSRLVSRPDYEWSSVNIMK